MQQPPLEYLIPLIPCNGTSPALYELCQEGPRHLLQLSHAGTAAAQPTQQRCRVSAKRLLRGMLCLLRLLQLLLHHCQLRLQLRKLTGVPCCCWRRSAAACTSGARPLAQAVEALLQVALLVL